MARHHQSSDSIQRVTPPNPQWLATGQITRAEENRANQKRNQIAHQMWSDYQDIVRQREMRM
ncbi:hypothetical protein C8Q76DRAFT_606991 [Earliella scabrosa]|nr:hypothetical protein C8Q76DRAFT_606991 [Earliella scabrosa]